MERSLALARQFGKYVVVVAAILAWVVVFDLGWASSEGSGFWPSRTATRGDVVNREKRIETAAERERRLARQTSEIGEKIADLRNDYLGDGRKTQGDDPKVKPRIPRDVARYTERDACLQMKLEHPDRFGDVDCFSGKFDDTDPWFQAPRRP